MGETDILPARIQNVLDMEIVRLNLWSIKFNASNIKLEGYVRSDDGNMMQKVCSEKICKRMNSTMLFDVSGRFYELSGQIDREYQAKIGMPNRVIDEFVNGFPVNWPLLINSCLTMEQRSVLRPIQDTPREPIRSRAEPIVTLADETELVENEQRNSDSIKERKMKERDELRARENERKLEAQREKEREEAFAVAENKKKKREQKEALAEAERKRREEEEEAANYTFRAPASLLDEAVTPIRFTRGSGSVTVKPIFQQTPVRGKSNGPLASSTPQAPSLQQQVSLSLETKSGPTVASSPKNQRPVQSFARQEYASDSDLFAVPKLPPPKTTRPPASAAPSDVGFDFLDQMDSLFENAALAQTPARDRKPRRESSISPDPRRRFSPPRDRDRYGEFESTRYSQKYADGYDRGHTSRRDAPYERSNGGRDESRMSRKRGYYDSPDESDYGRRRDERDRNGDYYDYDYKYEMKRSRPREASSSSGRSVRFENDYRGRREDSREPNYSRNHNEYDDYKSRGSSGDRDDNRKLNDILRREKELMARLQSHKPSSSSRRADYSSGEESDGMGNEWDRDNQEIMDNSMMFGDGISKKKRTSGGRRQPAKKPVRNTQPKPARKPTEPRKKATRSPLETDTPNDSIASNRPRRTCATPSTPAPKRVTWPKRDLDKLKHVIQLKKPTGADADWIEVARLLAKDGVDSELVKQTAITKLKWKEPIEENPRKDEEEEEEKKRRKGAAAKIKEGVRMHEELVMSRREVVDDLQGRAESMDDYQPEDVAADQSLLALGTPLAAKKKGGTRGSIMPKPIEDSPITRGRNSTFNSPRLDQTRVKEVETTLRYVQHLSNMQARPSSSANTSTLNKKSGSRASKNTSMSLEQGTRKAMKIVNRGRTIHEEDEEEESDDEDESEQSEDEAY